MQRTTGGRIMQREGKGLIVEEKTGIENEGSSFSAKPVYRGVTVKLTDLGANTVILVGSASGSIKYPLTVVGDETPVLEIRNLSSISLKGDVGGGAGKVVVIGS